ncbi:MAG TPA: BlaI/MecI/CopY family transcriptional regulator, partial [Gammaproteobacteria bacterium]|nr:BlaI/MecI/CopY family transcriptional regulator [Gammaproteobacteria bacterium]
MALIMELSKSEQRVLDVLWSESPLTVGQVIERLQKASDWHENTIKTLLTRLVQKKAVARRKDGGRFFYRPLVSRDAI